MTEGISIAIRSWYDSEAENGYLEASSRLGFYYCVGSSAPRIVMYTPKPGLVLDALGRVALPPDAGLVGRCALPSDGDVSWIQRLLECGKFGFLGDLDPIDLLQFAWLREQVGSSRIEYVGISELMLSAIDGSPPRSWLIDLDEAELRGRALLDAVFDDWRSVVGVRCESILEAKRKLELEAMVTHGGFKRRRVLKLIRKVFGA